MSTFGTVGQGEGRINLAFPSLARAKVSVQVFASADAYDHALCVRVLDRAFEKYGNSSTSLCERDDNARFLHDIVDFYESPWLQGVS